MKIGVKARELLDRYLLGVRRHLIGKDREDIAKEIESHIFDTLEERFPELDEVSVDKLEEIFREMGAPRKVAWQYRPQQSLIGPRFFPIYLIVARILVAVVVGAILLSSVIATVVGEPQSFWHVLGNFLGSAWSGALSAFGVVTLIFAGIERAVGDKSWEDMEDFEELKEMDEYKASDLPELPQSEKKFDRVETVFEIFFGMIGLAFLTYIQTSGGAFPVRSGAGESTQFIQIFTDNYLPLIPFAMGITGLELARSITLYVQGHHSGLTNWWHISTQTANVILMGFVLNAMPILTLNTLNEAWLNVNIANLDQTANLVVSILIGLGIFGTIIDVSIKTYREIKEPSF
jgi:hypothetical protein